MGPVTEGELVAKATAPRVTQEDLDANILAIHFINVGHALVMSGNDGDEVHESLDLLTICTLVLANGFVVTGESACASPENYDKDIGERIALAYAKNKIWALMGYELRSDLLAERGGVP